MSKFLYGPQSYSSCLVKQSENWLGNDLVMILISLDKHSARIANFNRGFSSVNLCFFVVNMETLFSSSNTHTALIRLQHDPEVELQLPKLTDWQGSERDEI